MSAILLLCNSAEFSDAIVEKLVVRGVGRNFLKLGLRKRFEIFGDINLSAGVITKFSSRIERHYLYSAIFVLIS